MDADHDSAWITIKADSYECMLSVDKLRAFPNSHLANLADIELQRNPVNPSIRLDCEPEVAKELVAIIRHGNNYAAPANNPRLCQVLQHQVDFFLGIPVPDVHAASSSRLQEYLLMPTSAFGEQLMMYSSRAHGWAVVRCNNDWPEQCGFEGARWLSAALPAERNGLGFMIADTMELAKEHILMGSWFQPCMCADVICMLPNDPRHEVHEESDGMMLKSDLTWGEFPAPYQHKYLGGSSMVAAQGQLYLLGGCPRQGWEGQIDPNTHYPTPPPLQVYDPHIHRWFDGPSPYPASRYLFHHALVSNKAEAMLLSIGGWLTDARLAVDDGDDGLLMLHNEVQRPMTDQVALFDTRSSSWSINPSGCRFPSAGQAKAVTAAYVDDWTIMVVSLQQQEGRQQQWPGQPNGRCAVDLLDLRTWRWRQGPDAPGVADLDDANMSAVHHDGKVHLHVQHCSFSCYDGPSNSWTRLATAIGTPPGDGPPSMWTVGTSPVRMRLPYTPV